MVIVIPKDLPGRWLGELSLVAIPEGANLVGIVQLEQLGDVKHEPTMTIDGPMQSQGPSINDLKCKRIALDEVLA
jgi:hypothetical protein